MATSTHTAVRSDAYRLAVGATALAALAGACALVVDAWGSKARVEEALAMTAGNMSDTAWREARDVLDRQGAALRADASIQELYGVSLVRSGDAQQGLAHLMKAVHRRPVSGFTWADIAEAKYQLGQLDARFAAALRNAALLGPGEREVQRTVASLGLATWDELDAPTREAVENVVAAGMKYDAAEMLSISKRRGRLGPACRHVERGARIPENLSRLCGKGEGAT